ncbi:unnamed protein product [Notodromas monacha]|uniref:Uncharacterized protein n=1 Tax=Notodromas monacha TaxID=399045 RepID=A0A7R9BNX2_9CRUS|nr:unnamed protein product [Notodromas monacha]CAG0917880.1 unnamed protein product [Notodromas monacha]
MVHLTALWQAMVMLMVLIVIIFGAFRYLLYATRAPTQVALQRLQELRHRGRCCITTTTTTTTIISSVRVAQQGVDGHDETRGAEPALGPVGPSNPLLGSVELVASGGADALHRGHGCQVDGADGRQTRVHGQVAAKCNLREEQNINKEKKPVCCVDENFSYLFIGTSKDKSPADQDIDDHGAAVAATAPVLADVAAAGGQHTAAGLLADGGLAVAFASVAVLVKVIKLKEEFQMEPFSLSMFVEENLDDAKVFNSWGLRNIIVHAASGISMEMQEQYNAGYIGWCGHWLHSDLLRFKELSLGAGLEAALNFLEYKACWKLAASPVEYLSSFWTLERYADTFSSQVVGLDENGACDENVMAVDENGGMTMGCWKSKHLPPNPYSGLTKYQLKVLREMSLREEDIASWHEWWFTTFPSGLMPRSSFRLVFEKYCPKYPFGVTNPYCDVVFDRVMEDTRNQPLGLGVFLLIHSMRMKNGLEDRLAWFHYLSTVDSTDSVDPERLKEIMKAVMLLKGEQRSEAELEEVADRTCKNLGCCEQNLRGVIRMSIGLHDNLHSDNSHSDNSHSDNSHSATTHTATTHITEFVSLNFVRLS